MSIKEKIIQFMMEEAYKPMTFEELAGAFNISQDDMIRFLYVLEEMEKEGSIIKTRKQRYGIPERMDLIVGKLYGHEKGFAFLIPDKEGYGDVFVPLENLNGAMHNDRVIVRLVKKGNGDRAPEGEVIRILERANEYVVGTFEKSRNFGFVIPQESRIFYDIFIPKEMMGKAENGQRVVVKITRWPERRRNPEGKIVEILGYKEEPGVDILSIIKMFNLPEDFPEKVKNQLKDIPEAVTSKDIKGRLDLRDLPIVTIDGEDAKDLDDAVSVEKLPNGNYKLGVHIADVSHYVKENTPLDKEAQKRGCSVYLVDRVIPMLPPKLSNGICSLNPKVDRLTLSVFMEINPNGEIVNHEIYESVIRSRERMTYTDVYKIVENKDAEVMKRYEDLVDSFNLMKELALILKANRMRRGSIDFDIPEAKIILDDNGKPIEIRKRERNIAHQIIEEFMIACNETIAERMYWLNVPFVYRVHENPDLDKIAALNRFLHNLGYRIKGIGDEVHPKALQEIVEKVKGKKEERVVNTFLLRSLKLAKYCEECLGHFGLASKYYTHFTSPIRRYPDLIIHRILKESLHNKLDEKRQAHYNKILKEIAKTSSEMERLAEEAERETEKLKMAEYMSYHIGEEFTGIISGVTNYGMFVELENLIEGLIHVSYMVDDYYHFDESNYCLRGERTKKTYGIGDEVRVRVIRSDVEKRQIDFVLVE